MLKIVELIVEPHLVRGSVVGIFRRSLQTLSDLRVTRKSNIFRPSFDLPSFDMLCKQLKDCLTVKQMENILTLTSNERRKCRLCTFVGFRDNWNDFSVVDRLSMVTSVELGRYSSVSSRKKTVSLSLTKHFLGTPSLSSMSTALSVFVPTAFLVLRHVREFL